MTETKTTAFNFMGSPFIGVLNENVKALLQLLPRAAMLVSNINLLAQAESAAIRQNTAELLDAVSNLRQANGLSPFADYYEAVARVRRGELTISRSFAIRAEATLDGTARDRAAVLLWKNHLISGDAQAAREAYHTVMRRAMERNDARTFATALSCEGITRSLEGDDFRAVDNFSEAFSIAVRLRNPQLVANCANGLAVSLAECGRLVEASQASHIAASSIFARFDAQYLATWRDIARRRGRSSCVQIRVPELPVRDEPDESTMTDEQSSLIVAMPSKISSESASPDKARDGSSRVLPFVRTTQALIQVHLHNEGREDIIFDDRLGIAQTDLDFFIGLYIERPKAPVGKVIVSITSGGNNLNVIAKLDEPGIERLLAQCDRMYNKASRLSG